MKQYWDKAINRRDPVSTYFHPYMDGHDHRYLDMPATWRVNDVFND